MNRGRNKAYSLYHQQTSQVWNKWS